MAAPTGAMLLPAETQRSHSFPLHYPTAPKLFQKSLVLTVYFWYNRGKKDGIQAK